MKIGFAVLALVVWATGVSAQTLTGITPVTTSTGAGSSLVAKAAAGSSLDVYAVNFTATPGYLVGYNATSVPVDGALTPALVIACAPLGANNSVNSVAYLSDEPGPSTNYTVGIVYFLTSASSCYTKTTGAITGFIAAKVQ